MPQPRRPLLRSAAPSRWVRAGMACLCLTSLAATDFTWDGGAGTGVLSTAANWVGDVAPTNQTTDNLIFTGTVQTSLTNNLTTVGTITFSAGGFTLASGTLNVRGIAGNVGATTISTPLTLGAAQSFSAASGATLTISGTVANGGFVLTGAGAGTVTISGVISGTGALVANGTGIVDLSAANTYTGTTTATAGTLRASNSVVASTNGAFGNAAGAVVINGGVIEVNTATFSRDLSALNTGGRLDAFGAARTVSSAITMGLAANPSGLTGTYFATSLRSFPQDDWRSTQTVTGTRADSTVNFPGNAFGTDAERLAFGIGGSSTDWDNFSVQWDGFMTVVTANTTVFTRSDDGSRMWIDLDNDNVIDAGEFVDNGFGSGQGETTRIIQSNLAVGTYRIRVQHEEGNGGNAMFLLWDDAANSAGTIDSKFVVPSSKLSSALNTFQLGGTTVVSAGGQALTVSGVISGTGLVTKTLTSTATISGVATFTGDLTIEGGTLALGAANVLPDASAVSQSASTTFDLAGFAETVGSLTGSGTVSLGAGTLTTGGANTSTTYGGIISGTGGVTKAGSGVFTLTGANTCTGAATVNAGTLTVDGSLSSTTVTAASGGTLAGTGTMNAVSVSAGGTVSPGTAGPTIVDVSQLTFTNSTSTLVVQINSTVAGTGFDQIAITGNGSLTLANATLSGSTGFTPTIGNTFRIIELLGTGTITGTFNGVAEGGSVLLGSSTYTVSYVGGTGNDVVLTAAATPSFTWDGGGADNNWTTAANWVGDVAPSADSALVFAGVTRLSNTNNFTAGTAFSSITINATGFTLSGNALTLVNGLSVTAGSSTVALNSTLAQQAQTYNASSGATLTVSGTVTNGGFALTGTAGGTLTISGAISGSGALVANGAGVLTLSGANTFTGALTMNVGTVRTAGGAAIADTVAVTLANVAGVILDLNGTSETVGSLAGGGTTGGNVTLGAGTLTSGGDNTSTTFAGVASGTGGLTKAGTGVLTLSGTNTFTGAATINAGTLRLSGGTAIADTVAVVLANVAGAILDLNGTSETVGSLAGGGTTGGAVTLGAGTLTSGGDNTTTTFAGVASGTGGLTKAGTGVLTLSGTNTFTGAATINAGTLRTAGGTAIADTVAVVLANVAGAILDLNGTSETVGSLAGGGTTGGNVTLGAGTLTSGGDNTSTTFAGVASGTGGLTKAGTGVLTLSGTNTFTGAATVNAGTLRPAGGTAIANTAAVVLANVAGAILDLNGTSETVGSLAGGGTTGGNVTLGAGTLTSGDDNTSTTFAGVISGTGAVTKAGSGTLTLTGTNTHTGNTSITAGTLSVSSDGNFGAVPGTPTDRILITNNAVVLVTATMTTGVNRRINFGAGGGGTLNVAASVVWTVDSSLQGNNVFTKLGPGQLTLTVDSARSSQTLINDGVVRITAQGGFATSSPTPTHQVNNSAVLEYGVTSNRSLDLSGNATLRASGGSFTSGGGSGSVASGATITVQGVLSTDSLTLPTMSGGGGGATVTVSGAGTVIGGTGSAGTFAVTVNGASTCALRLNSATGVGVATNTITVTSGSLVNNVGTVAYPLTLNGGTLAAAGADRTYSGTVAASVASTVSLDDGITTGTARSITLSGVFSGSAALALTAPASGKALILTNTGTTYSGSLTVGGNATLRSGAAGTFGTAMNVLLNASGTCDLASNAESVASLGDGAGTPAFGTVTLGSATLTVSGATSRTYSGVISGTGALTKAGTSTLTLAGANTFTGAATINAGTLRTAGGTAIADTVAVTLANAAGAILDLNGTSETVGSLAGGGTTGGTVTLGAGTLTSGGDNTSTTFAGVASGTGGLTKAGTGVLTLSGTNTFTGAATINAGTLRPSGGTAIADTVAVVLANVAGAILDLNGTSETVGSLAGGGSTGGAVTLGAGTLTSGGDNTTTTFAGVASGTGGLTKAGTGVLTLSGTNTFTGAATINAGTLRTAGGTAIADTVAVTLANVAGAILDLNGTSETVGSLAGGGTTGGNVTLGAGTLTSGGNNTSTTFAGVASGTGGLTKAGTGVLTLSGTNTFTGATAANVGTLSLTGALSVSSAVTVASAATLAGTGTAAGTIAANGQLSAGVAGAGTLSTGAITMASTTVLTFGLGDPAVSATSDRIASTGAITLQGNLDVVALASFGVGTYTLLTYSGSTPTDNLVVRTMPSGFHGGIDLTVNGQVRLVVSVAAVRIEWAAGSVDSAGAPPATVISALDWTIGSLAAATAAVDTITGNPTFIVKVTGGLAVDMTVTASASGLTLTTGTPGLDQFKLAFSTTGAAPFTAVPASPTTAALANAVANNGTVGVDLQLTPPASTSAASVPTTATVTITAAAAP